MSQCRKLAHKLLYQPIHRNTMSTRGSCCGLIFPQIVNVEIESAKLVLSVVETYLFRNLETKN